MPPRATVQQAIELLKIHQIRRENAAIYQQLQTYRDEVSDLKNAHDELRTSIDNNHTETNVLRNTASETNQRLVQVDRKLEHATRDRTVLHVELKSLQTQQTDLSKHLEDKCADHVNDVEAVETKIQELRDKNNVQFKTWTEELVQIQRKLVEVAGHRFLGTSNNDNTQSTAIGAQDKISGQDQASRVDNSIQERDLLSADNVVQYLPDTNLTSTTEDLNSDLLLTLQPRDRLRESTVPDDVDLDAAANEISYAGHGRAVVSHHDSFVMLPYQITNEFQSIDEVVSLAQKSQETLVDYLDRGQNVLAHFPQGLEGIIIRRWVHGLADKNCRQNFIKWLTTTSWSQRDLLNIAHIYGIYTSKASDPAQAVSIHVQESATQDPPPTVLVPETDVGSNNSHVMPEVTHEPLLSPVRIEPRRSQRIAARLQQETQPQATESTETESQAQRLDARIAEAAKRRETKTKIKNGRSTLPAANPLLSSSAARNLEPKKQPTIGQSKKRKRADEEAAADELGKGDRGVRLHSNQQSKKTNNKRVKKTIARVPDVQPENNLDMTGQLEMPHTPSKHRIRAKLADESPKHPVWLPSSPSNGKKARTTQIPRHNLKQPRTAPIVPSPYNPKPRLVLHEHIPKARATDLLSDSDVFLPRPGPNKPQTRGDIQASKQRAPVRYAKKKRRLPLPPPPEIPILSTSTEENRRFDKW